MKSRKQQFRFSKKLLALSVLVAFGHAHAEDDDLAEFTKPSSSIGAGLGAVTGDKADRSIFGQYNGMRQDSASLLLDVNVLKRNEATGTWTILDGRNLGLDDRELSFSQIKQGDWKYSAEYSENVRHDPRTINTGLLNAGTTSPTVVSLASTGTGADLNLELKRKGFTLGGEKWLSSNLMFEASFKNEDKDGARLSGIGLACSAGGNFTAYSRYACGSAGALLMMPEPINSTTRQFEAKLNFSGDKFIVSGGYYGSFFTNSNGSLNPNMTASGFPAGLNGYLQQPLALPADNQAHQLYVSGNYAFTPTTHATFKYAYTHATQNEDFGSMGLTGAPAGVSNLSGVVDSNLAQFGLTARPMAKLSVLANVRYEDKNDKTPLDSYSVNAAPPYTVASPYSAAQPYSNNLSSSKKLNGKLEATYQLPGYSRATLGVDYASVDRASPRSLIDPGASDVALALGALREETKEIGYRAELRRTMSETLNAAISYGQARRDGDSWTIYSATGTYPMTMLDRQRDKVRLSADWTPSRELSLQFIIEDGKDKYTAPTQAGMQDTGMRTVSVDAAYKLSEKWRLTGYLSQGNQTLHVNQAAGYMAELDNVNTAAGLGVVGKLSGKLEIGGDLSYVNDSNRYNLVAGGLPDVTYRVTNLKVFGTYALEKNTDIRVDLVYQNAKLDEWTWNANGTPFAYTDNTTVAMQPNQSVTFLGARYIYKFR